MDWSSNSDADGKDVSLTTHDNVITVSAMADFDGKAEGAADPTCRDDVGEDDEYATFSNYGDAGVLRCGGKSGAIRSHWSSLSSCRRCAFIPQHYTTLQTGPNPVPPTRKQLERELKDAENALRAARTALLDPEPNMEPLAAKRDEAQRHWHALLAERARLRTLELQLREHLGPIDAENDRELVAEIQRVRREHEAMAGAIKEADEAARRACHAYHAAAMVHGYRPTTVSRLEQLVLSLERELQRSEPRRVFRARSWRDLIEEKR